MTRTFWVVRHWNGENYFDNKADALKDYNSHEHCDYPVAIVVKKQETIEKYERYVWGTKTNWGMWA